MGQNQTRGPPKVTISVCNEDKRKEIIRIAKLLTLVAIVIVQITTILHMYKARILLRQYQGPFLNVFRSPRTGHL